ncbi:hypothetical protein BGT96224_3230 [Blumeria graminis f. sp. tritici 96224]|uniref:PH domain-containing protein n=1 Tax=Blumeria graminis f. sp. tritici 96224 TaxID=1268274 RepID=A0A656KLY1_BLUGR|nr:hypothetical protein BGT96224_3230 [Blumeria graminis f. sp. tritici 96224]
MEQLKQSKLSPHDEKIPSRLQNVSVQPREDEGKETLPAYSTSISLSNIFNQKMELEGPAQRAVNRSWSRVSVVLQGTALNIYRKSADKKKSGCQNIDYSIRSYNLHYAQVGIATDYNKSATSRKRYVIRVRAETEQFLLSCANLEIFVTWIQSLSAAIDLATPLDDREYPEDFSLPRRQRRIHTLAWSMREAPVNRDSQQINNEPRSTSRSAGQNCNPHTSSYRRNLHPTTNNRSHPGNISSFESEAYLCRPSNSQIRARRAARSSRPSFARRSYTFISRQLCSMLRPSPTRDSDETTFASEDVEKWRPCHYWTHSYDMLYATRCLAVLNSRTPRKSNIVVANGEFLIVDWVTGATSSICGNAPHIPVLVETSNDYEIEDAGANAKIPPKYEEPVYSFEN